MNEPVDLRDIGKYSNDTTKAVLEMLQAARASQEWPRAVTQGLSRAWRGVENQNFVDDVLQAMEQVGRSVEVVVWAFSDANDDLLGAAILAVWAFQRSGSRRAIEVVTGAVPAMPPSLRSTFTALYRAYLEKAAWKLSGSGPWACHPDDPAREHKEQEEQRATNRRFCEANDIEALIGSGPAVAPAPANPVSAVPSDTQDIFMSYRRDGGENLAARVKDALKARGFSVFMDIEDLKSGKFNEALFQKIEAATDFLVILTPGCLERCQDEEDWLRKEIRHAIACKRNIVPILARGFQMPHPQALPADMSELPNYHGLAPVHELFEASIDRLASTFLKAPHKGATAAPEYSGVPPNLTAVANLSPTGFTLDQSGVSVWFATALSQDVVSNGFQGLAASVSYDAVTSAMRLLGGELSGRLPDQIRFGPPDLPTTTKVPRIVIPGIGLAVENAVGYASYRVEVERGRVYIARWGCNDHAKEPDDKVIQNSAGALAALLHSGKQIHFGPVIRYTSDREYPYVAIAIEKGTPAVASTFLKAPHQGGTPASGFPADAAAPKGRSEDFSTLFVERPDVIAETEVEAARVPAHIVAEFEQLLVRLEVHACEPRPLTFTAPEDQAHRERLLSLIDQHDGKLEEAQLFVTTSRRPGVAYDDWRESLSLYQRAAGAPGRIRAAIMALGTAVVPLVCLSFRRFDSSDAFNRTCDGFDYTWRMDIELAKTMSQLRDLRALPFIAEAVLRHADDMNGHHDWGIGMVRAIRAFGADRVMIDSCLERLVGVTASEILREKRDGAVHG